ncbi:MAG: TMEM175 family protein [Caldilineales bacterium]|nr:TMEM175 family protein [Caldilineales bacterium]
MTKGRMEAFSDGVIAIIITIMVLELRPPEGTALADLLPLAPIFLSYVLSFVSVGIYWNNHHHMLQAARHVDGRVLWANIHLLFWLSLAPFATAWMGEHNFAAWPVAVYGFVLLMAGVAYFILSRALIAVQGKDSLLAEAVGRDRKGMASMAIYAIAIPIALFAPWLAFGLYVLVAIIWFIPDRRIEKTLAR